MRAKWFGRLTINMDIKIGSDIVHIPRFKKTFSQNREYFLRKIFLSGESKTDNEEHLAGIFAAKEAAMKGLQLKPGQWLRIEIAYKETGKPFFKKFPKSKYLKHDLTISHDGEYAVAFVVFCPKRSAL